MKAERLVRVLRRKQEDAIQKFRNCARGVVQAYCQLHEHKFIRGEGVPTAHTSSFDACSDKKQWENLMNIVRHSILYELS